MNRILRLTAAAVIAVALVLWAAIAWVTSENPPSPPLGGAMAKFTVASDASPAPQTRLVAKDGRTTALAAFRDKLLLVNFWATWCAPCIKEMPSLARLQAKLGGTGFAVLALSEDLKGWPVIEPFLESHGLAALPVLHDPQGATGRALGVSGLPTTILFDGEGRELGRLLGAAEWDQPDALRLIRHYLGGAETPG